MADVSDEDLSEYEKRQASEWIDRGVALIKGGEPYDYEAFIKEVVKNVSACAASVVRRRLLAEAEENDARRRIMLRLRASKDR